MRKKWRPERECDKAVQEELEREMGCKYVSGSLFELAEAEKQFEGSEAVTIYLLELGEEPTKKCNNRAVDERAWDATTKEEVWIDTNSCDPLRGSGLLGAEDPKKRRYRRLTAFFDEMYKRRMFRLADERDFVRRYCFVKMMWEGMEIEHIYFNNKDCRKVFLQHKPQAVTIPPRRQA
jgi:hypothetical protein